MPFLLKFPIGPLFSIGLKSPPGPPKFPLTFSEDSLELLISLERRELLTSFDITAPTPAPTSNATNPTMRSSETNCIVSLDLLIPMVRSTPISYFLSRMLIMLIMNNTIPPMTKVMIRKVVAKAWTFLIDFRPAVAVSSLVSAT